MLQPAGVCSTTFLRGGQRATLLLQPCRGQQSSASPAKVDVAKPAPTGGRMSNVAEFTVTKLDDLLNWGRRVIKDIILYCYEIVDTLLSCVVKWVLLD